MKEDISKNCPYCGRDNAINNCDCILSQRAKTFQALIKELEQKEIKKKGGEIK